MGFPKPSEKDHHGVQVGNMLMLFSFNVFDLCHDLKIPCTIEDPASSLLWSTPAAKQAFKVKGFCEAVCEFCMFGMPWRKSTRLIGVHIGIAQLSCHRCLDKTAGLCKRTMRPNIVLSGHDPNQPKQFLTLSAQVYPRKLCTILANAFRHANMFRRIANFEALFKL